MYPSPTVLIRKYKSIFAEYRKCHPLPSAPIRPIAASPLVHSQWISHQRNQAHLFYKWELPFEARCTLRVHFSVLRVQKLPVWRVDYVMKDCVVAKCIQSVHTAFLTYLDFICV